MNACPPFACYSAPMLHRTLIRISADPADAP